MMKISECLIIIDTVIGVLLLIAGSVGILTGSTSFLIAGSVGILIISLMTLYLETIFKKEVKGWE